MPIQQMMFPNYAVALNAAPVFRNSGSTDSGNGAVSPGLPSGTALNDILICVVQSSNQPGGVPTNSVGGTWFEITNSPQGTGTPASAGAVGLSVFWMRSPGAAAAIGTVTVADTGNHTIAGILGFTGCVTSGNPWDITAGNTGAIANNAWATLPNITTTVGNTLVMCAWANSFDNATTPFTAVDFTATNIISPGAGVIWQPLNITTGTGGGIGVLAMNPFSNTVMSSSGSLSTGGNGNVSGIIDPAWKCSASGACNWAAITIALRSN